MIINIGWKNVWRNKTRSLVVIIAVLLGIFGGVMSSAIMKGWIAQRIHSSIYNETSHVQIHNPDFLLNEDIEKTIPGYEQVINALDTIPEVVAYSPRIKINSLANTARGTAGLVLKGVNPDNEKKVSELYKSVIEGDFLEGDYRTPSIVIGDDAAESLKLKYYVITPEAMDTLNSELYAAEAIEKLKTIGKKKYRTEKDFTDELEKTLSKDEFDAYSDNLINVCTNYKLGRSISVSLNSKSGKPLKVAFKVRGIYQTSNSMFDKTNAFVNINYLKNELGFNENEVHEIAIISTDNETGAELGDKLQEYLPKVDVMSWRKISPEIAMYTDFVALMGVIFVSIILLALSFAIINTMMMSVLERIKELGMLMAIGMNKKRVFFLIMTESVFLTLTGAIAGMIFSVIIIAITAAHGIDLSMFQEGFEALGYSSVVYPEASLLDFLLITLLVFIAGILSAIMPARKALKLNPVEALRTE